MMLGLLFVFGILNFAAHKAVLESRHPLVESLPASLRKGGGRVSLLFEFLILVTAMILVEHGWMAAAWGYGFYTALNAGTAWLILNERI